MSRYATPTDLAKLAVNAAALSGISPDDQQTALDAASAVLDSYLASRFTLPLIAPFPADLVRHTCGIAAYDLLTVRGYNPENGDTTWRQRYDDAIGWGKDIAQNKAHPQVADSQPISGTRPPRVVSKCPRGW